MTTGKATTAMTETTIDATAIKTIDATAITTTTTTALALAATLMACSLHKVVHDPAPPVPVPVAYHTASGGAAAPEKWWTDFGDGALNAMIDRALADNLQLRAAWARVSQARAVIAQANSGKWPQVELSATAQRQETQIPPQFRDLAPGIGSDALDLFTYSIGAGYEVDLWKRIDSQGKALAMDAMAARDAVGAIAISLAAEVTETWFDIIALRAQRDVITRQQDINQTYLELIELRFRQGLASALDIYQQRQQIVATRARLTLIDSGLALLDHKLAILVGQAPGAIRASATAPSELPALPPAPGIGVPADLLTRRPDVRAARRQVEAADYRVAAAVADRLPSLRLSVGGGRQETSVVDIFMRPLYNLLASVTAPLLDGGRRKAEVERNEAVVRERLMDYGQALLGAMVEVENAAVQERQQALYIQELEQSIELAGQTLAQAQARYGQGLIDYLPVLAALQAQQQAELSIVAARRDLLSYRVQLYRALGGTWTTALEAPELGERDRLRSEPAQAQPAQAEPRRPEPAQPQPPSQPQSLRAAPRRGES